ncbi:MAG: SprT family zinc-dependent metalloprotease [Chloroflexota bacterium]
MVNSYTINIDGLGLIILERSLRAKRIVISVKPFKGVRVAVPARESFKSAEKFLFSKTGWIKSHLEKMQQYENEQEAKQASYDDIDIAAAKKTLTGRLKQLANKHGFKYGKLSIKSQRTRWGSCSPTNNISLNAKLVKLPDDLVDYVILHELVHTHVHNHSKKFWAELDRYVENARVMAKRLRTNGLELI